MSSGGIISAYTATLTTIKLLMRMGEGMNEVELLAMTTLEPTW